MKKIIAVIGPTGAGKTSILREAYRFYKDKYRSDSTVKIVVTTTDRERRPGEVHGTDYNFIPTLEFKEKLLKKEFVEYKDSTKDDGTVNLYGLTKAALGDLNDDSVLLLSIDLGGLIKLEEYLNKEGLDANSILMPIYIKASAEARFKRCLSRERIGSSIVKDELVYKTCQRILNDKEELKDSEDFCAFSIRNENDGEKYECVSLIVKLIQGML